MRESDIEHFRPKADVTNCREAGYWWLAYSWKNLLFSCRHCNQEHKKNHFPLIDERDRARRPRDSVKRERPYLIDPSIEDPRQFIGFDWSGSPLLVRPYGRDEEDRGKKTIKILGLDCLDLNEERAAILDTLNSIVTMMHAGQHYGKPTLVEQAAARIKNETSCSRKFAGFAREYFRSYGFDDCVAQD